MFNLDSMRQIFVREKSIGADKIIIEEVFGFGVHHDELYITGALEKIDF